jgi:hypothetical protein
MAGIPDAVLQRAAIKAQNFKEELNLDAMKHSLRFKEIDGNGSSSEDGGVDDNNEDDDVVDELDENFDIVTSEVKE